MRQKCPPVGAGATVRRVASPDRKRCTRSALLEIKLNLSAFLSAIRIIKVHGVLDLESGRWRLRTDVHGVLAGGNGDSCSPEVNQQGTWGCVVGSGRFAINGIGINGPLVKERVVNDEVAPDVGNASVTQLPCQQPESFDHEPGITAAFENQITVKCVALYLAVNQRLCMPAMLWSQQLQSSGGGHEFHGGCRIATGVRIVAYRALL